MTVFEHVEKLKRDYTDKYVLVDEGSPELARFQGQTGRVKTINMNGRALVEFEQYVNSGWFDIDVDYLRVIDRPLPKEEEKPTKVVKKATKKRVAASGDKKLSPLEMARMQDSGGATKSAAATDADGEKEADTGKKLSTADILAAARNKKVTAGSAEAAVAKDAPAKDSTGKDAGPKDASSMTLAEKLAAARGKKPDSEPTEAEAAPTATKETTAKDAAAMTLAEKLAAARGESSGAASPEKIVGDSNLPETNLPETESASSAEDTGASATAAGGEVVDKSIMSVADMIMWCRAHDGS